MRPAGLVTGALARNSSNSAWNKAKRSGSYGMPLLRARAREVSSLTSRVPRNVPISSSSKRNSSAMPSCLLASRPSSLSLLRAASPPWRNKLSSRSSSSGLDKVRATPAPRLRDGRMFSSQARGAEHSRISPKNGGSFARGGWPLRGRKVMPGKLTGRVPDEMMKTAPSAAGQFSSAVRSEISASGK